MKTYLIHPRPGSGIIGQFQVTYDANGLMHAITNYTNIATEDLLYKAMAHIPLDHRHIATMKARGIRVDEVPADLSFDAFWNKYNYKLGKKERAKKLWECLTDADRARAINAIKAYDTWLSQRSIEKVYPETYLSQRRWENDFGTPATLFG